MPYIRIWIERCLVEVPVVEEELDSHSRPRQGPADPRREAHCPPPDHRGAHYPLGLKVNV
jgi:hypothetical protein